MNIFRNALPRLGQLRGIAPGILHNGSSSYCTTAENVPSTVEYTNETALELDKLYKRLELEIRGNEPAVIKSYVRFASTAANHLGIEPGENWALRKAFKERRTFLKSIFVHKKHRVQYEMRTYYHFMHFHRLTSSTCDTFLEYIERNLPEGVAMKVTKVEMQKLPEYMLPMFEKLKMNDDKSGTAEK